MANNNTYCIVPANVVNILFRIPLYQRLFAWTSGEVLQLMEDLKAHFDKHNNDGKKYYLGMLTVVNQKGRLDLIDGQQRMAALALLAIGFSKALTTIDKELAYSWRNVVFDEKSNPRIYFNGRSEDRDYLQRLAQSFEKQSNEEYVNVKMKEGLETVLQFLEIKKDENSNFDDDNSLINFARQVYNGMAFFITELPNHYVNNPASLNEYFEAMNSCGKSLEQHEILKVQLLRDQPDEKKIAFTRLWNTVSDFSKPIVPFLEDNNSGKSVTQKKDAHFDEYKKYLYQCRINQIDAVIDQVCFKSEAGLSMSIASIPVEKKKESDNDEIDKEDGIMSFSKFLLHVLDIVNEAGGKIARISPSKLLPTFKENPPRDIVMFYHLLLECRLLLDAYVVRIKKTSGGNQHVLISRNSEDDAKVQAHRRLCQFQSMLDVSTEPHIWILPLLQYLRTENCEPSQMELLKFLMIKDYEREHHYEITNTEERNPENLSYGAKPRYWLWRLDYAIWEKLILEGKDSFAYTYLDAEAIKQYEFRSNRSIEHLHPQNQDHNDEWSWEDVNSFGNLAMISQSFNSQQSNLPVHVKFANLEVQIGNKSLQSLKLYFMYLQAKGSDEEWTVKAKDQHASEMLKILNDSLEIVKGFSAHFSDSAKLSETNR